MADITIQNFNGDQDLTISSSQLGQNNASTAGTSLAGDGSGGGTQNTGGQNNGTQNSTSQSSGAQSDEDQNTGNTQNSNTLAQSPNIQNSNQTSQGKNKQGNINLEDEALLMSQQTIAPPEKYNVPALVKEKFPDLIQLIKETESMSDEERDYWFQVLPIMTEEQIQKFRTILVNEKEQLARLDREYEDHIQKLNEKHMIEWKEFESKQKREAIATAEAETEQEEAETEEALLQRLSQA